MHYEKLNLSDSHALKRFADLYRFRITRKNFSARMPRITFAIDKLSRFFSDLRVQLDSDSVSAHATALDQGRPASQKRIKHPVILLRVPEQQLTRNLRNEIAPVPAQMRPCRIAFREVPEAVGQD